MNKGIENILKNTPLPAAGLAFGVTGLGSLFSEFGQGMWAKPLFGVLGFALLLIPLLKIIYFPNAAKENLKNPIQAAVVPVIFGVFMLDAGFLSDTLPISALTLWLLSVVMMTLYSAWFIWRFLIHFQLKQVFAAFFIPFVGFAILVMTSHNLAQTFTMIVPLRTFLFNFASIGFVAMLAIISWRYLTLPASEDAAKPVFAIYTAPLAVLIVSYVRLPIEHSTTNLTIALLISQGLFFMVLSQVPTFLKNGFYPSYAALTFPFIITANSLWESLPIFEHSPLIQSLAWLESLFAVVMTLFVLYKYIGFFRKTAKGI